MCKDLAVYSLMLARRRWSVGDLFLVVFLHYDGVEAFYNPTSKSISPTAFLALKVFLCYKTALHCFHSPFIVGVTTRSSTLCTHSVAYFRTTLSIIKNLNNGMNRLVCLHSVLCLSFLVESLDKVLFLQFSSKQKAHIFIASILHFSFIDLLLCKVSKILTLFLEQNANHNLQKSPRLLNYLWSRSSRTLDAKNKQGRWKIVFKMSQEKKNQFLFKAPSHNFKKSKKCFWLNSRRLHKLFRLDLLRSRARLEWKSCSTDVKM